MIFFKPLQTFQDIHFITHPFCLYLLFLKGTLKKRASAEHVQHSRKNVRTFTMATGK